MEKVILFVVAFFAVLGGLDRLFGNRFGIGQKFDEGFMAMGNLALSILGIYSIAPVIAKTLVPIVKPLFNKIGADPSIFISSILACDMGAYHTALEIAKNKELVVFSGLLLGSMLGATISYTIPVASRLIEKEDYPYFIKGILAGIITLPIGNIIGGIMIKMRLSQILINLIPVIFISLLLCIGLIKLPKKTISLFSKFNKVIVFIGLISLIIGIIQKLTGLTLIKNMKQLDEGLLIVGNIAVFLSGAYPMTYIITKVFSKAFNKIGKRFGIGENGVAGIIVTLANNIPAFSMMKEMNIRGKIIVTSFAVSGAFVLGGQLGFVASVEPSYIIPVVIGKLTSGISGIILAFYITKDYDN